MGLSLKAINQGVADVGNVLLDGVKKFNEIRKEAAGVVPSNTTVAANATRAATAGTVAQVATERRDAAGGSAVLVVIGLVLLLLWKR